MTPPTQDLVADFSEDERHLLLEHGEEAPFCGVLLTGEAGGVYTCRLCGLPLFKAAAEVEGGSGWPNFTAPFAEEHLRDLRDTSYGMVSELLQSHRSKLSRRTLTNEYWEPH